MAKFGTKMQRTSSTTLSVGAITAASSNPRRAKIYDLMFGSYDTAGDATLLWQVQRCTTAGTATTNPTPNFLDPSDTQAATTVIGENHSVDPTLTSNAFPLTIPLNQRATFRWVSAPGSEIIVPATASNGVAIRTPSSTSLITVALTALFDEQ